MLSKFRKLNKKKQNLLSLYVHWPYCESKCPYCDFNSHVNETINVNDWIKSYKNQLLAMKEELIKNDINFKNLNTLFFGGGTPSLMPLKIIEFVIDISNEIFGFKQDIEITLEANPNSYDRKKFIQFKQLGINRISVGAQSLNNKYLNFLGRLHNIKDVKIALTDASAIFDNISVDLMYAFNGQKIDDWISELENFLNFFNLQHLSLYQLTIEEGTRFFKDHKNGKIKLIENDIAAKFYDISNKVLNNYKFIKYEVSNYAKKGFKCKHNLNYWNSENWIGVGPGAYGRLWSLGKNKSRIEYQNYKNPKTWLFKNLKQPEFEKITKLNSKVSDIDTLTMGLRLYDGIKVSKINNLSIINFKSLKELQNKKIISFKDDTLKVNKKHMIKLNSILDYLINP
ncbi:MAG: radical SAM protein [Alphaproteobacteria bacterium TMED199]|nr:MAG: radical SAM protein [Alphaproteobacteria bacterium TMED199]